MATTNKVVRTFGFDQETKTTVRFKELDEEGNEAENPLFGKVYVKKSQLTKWKDPKHIKVTVEPSND